MSEPKSAKASVMDVRVILEACPPPLADRDKAYAVLRQSFACYNSFHAVSVPDLQDEGEFMRERARVPNQEFAQWLREVTEKPLSLYKVVVACSRGDMEKWLEHAAGIGCRDIFVVGGDSSSKQYRPDGLTVGSAAALAAERGFHCGGIIIPTRRKQFVARPASEDEVDRVINKINAHDIRFFSTQILYESEWMCSLLLDLVRRVEANELPKIFLTFSPFVVPEDIHFAKKTLGVFMPADVERMLKGARSMREASISVLIGVWERLSSFAGQIGFPASKLGVNIEYLDSRNPRSVDSSFELAEEFGRIFRKHTAA
jgi:hypothetical protein